MNRMPDPFLSRRAFLKAAALSLGAGTLHASAAPQRAARFRLGIDNLIHSDFSALRGQRVGLLTHPAGVDSSGNATIQILHRAASVNLVALFGPEHGIYGDEKANVPVEDRTDPRTGLPVFSLYGRYRRPTPAMLDQIDTMVVDLQDIGSRSYTYISCLRYVMEECFKADKTVIVLDRPNPLGGLKVDGPPLESRWRSYVGAWPVPYVHGLTIGELARMGHGRADILEIDPRLRRRGRLRVIPMSGWKRSMMWNHTGLRWIPTSPAIPNLSAVLGYPMTGLGAQLGDFAHGYGTQLPFRLLQYRGKSPEAIAKALSARRIRGMAFPVTTFQHRGQTRRAVFTRVTDFAAFRPTELSLHMMALACQWDPANPFASASTAQQNLFTKHVGDSRVMDALIQKGAAIDIPAFLQSWHQSNRAFLAEARKWHLYQD